MSVLSRRRFLQGTVAAAAAASVRSVLGRSSQGGASEAAWAARVKVHPNIDDLRVVGIIDPKMTKEVKTHINWAQQEQLVAAEPVGANLDKLACALAEAKDPKEAWKTIFVKPAKKSWAETVVAIKTNNIHLQYTRSAVMAKTCRVLTEVLGVKAANVHIYDACHGATMHKTSPFKGLPEGCRVEGKWGGSTVVVPVGRPYTRKATKCVKPLTDGTVDILINIALCKGHGRQFGGFTMSMKNHLGTFSPRPAHREGMDYLVAINQTPQILGATDPKTGKVPYPRQQLCLIDALWASKPGPGGLPTAQPNFLAMGVFGPAVDYLMATEFRDKKMGAKPNDEALENMLKNFALAKSDFKGIVPVPA